MARGRARQPAQPAKQVEEPKKQEPVVVNEKIQKQFDEIKNAADDAIK